MKILVADDDAVSRTMMRRMLIQSGYEVATASNGVEAVNILMAHDAPRLVLLDWMMPELDGPEVCKAIRTTLSDAYTYITLLTSKGSKEDLIAGLEAGADDYLIKPCNLEELRARLRTGQRILQLEDFLVRAREEMRFKASHDALTLLLNRDTILHCLSSLLKERRVGFSIVLCDVDHFKRINDTYGHPVGDEVLREVASRLKLTLWDADVVGRYGGEEFLLLLHDDDSMSWSDKAERICETIRCRPIQTTSGPIPVSISAGALHLCHEQMAATADQILKIVDEALYEAKHAGRDRLVATTHKQNITLSSSGVVNLTAVRS